MKKNLAITSRATSFSDWYTNIVEAAQLIHYSGIKGFMTFLPRGWAIWEQIQKYMNQKFKTLKIQNVALPSLFPYSDLIKEKHHVQGFNPELFLISQKGDEKLGDPYVLRPTSEVAFCELWSETLQTYQQLPFLYNQWCSVFRVEKSTRPFLRNSEFHWQEVHCAFADEQSCLEMVKAMNDAYSWLINEILMMYPLAGEKTPNERFAGALNTYTLETIMPDGQALQSSTSHHLGQNFAQAFDIKFQNKDNKYSHVYTMSAGISTRIIGALIMSHSDDNGLVLPFKIAPEQIVIIPLLADKNPDILKAANLLYEQLVQQDYRVIIDNTNASMGSRLATHEVNGVPFSIVIGPNDLKTKTLTIKIRNQAEKINVAIDELNKWLKNSIQTYDQQLYEASKSRTQQAIVKISTYEQFEQAIKDKKVVLAPWFEDPEAEAQLKTKTGATARCINLKLKVSDEDKCFYSGKKATNWVYFARAY
ncbi:proline--tRNA ligase [[Mycoplasma] testudinis]|uniref:proline--tRNA ligase n=1 Tax=[Mycoplasma] testudinis TaxID=33924 RepID=UPI0004809B67|nr:proline--tRNA ligase [[Mycoplasma] testudinis]